MSDVPSPVDEATARMMTYLVENKEDALSLAQKIHDLILVEKANTQLALVSLAAVVKGVADSFPDAEENRNAVRCIAAGMLAANITLNESSALVVS